MAFVKSEGGLLIPQGERTREVWADARLLKRTLKFCLDRGVQVAFACPKCQQLMQPQEPSALGEVQIACSCRSITWR